MRERETWKSRTGFILAALGSAVGLGSIWRFPYMVGENGGSAFIFLYLLFLALMGLPVLLSEIAIGKKAQKNPFGAMKSALGKRGGFLGKMLIITGLLISSFYSVIAGWTVSYFFSSLSGKVSLLQTSSKTAFFFSSVSTSFSYSLLSHAFFLSLCLWILISGVKKGIEAKSKILMPLLFLVLLFLSVYALFLPGGTKGLSFLFSFDLSKVTPTVWVAALGQAFFTLSLGQGTMITYGSYLPKKEEIVKSCIPVVLLNLFLSLVVGIAVYGIVFSFPIEVDKGPSLIFETLPLVFSSLPFGSVFSSLFFFLVVIAALTSEISALEPAISYLVDEKGFSRKRASVYVVALAFVLGIFSILSFTSYKYSLFQGISFYEAISYFSVNILVPLGGLVAVLTTGWKWKKKMLFQELSCSEKSLFSSLLIFCLRYVTPLLIVYIFFDLLFSFNS